MLTPEEVQSALDLVKTPTEDIVEHLFLDPDCGPPLRVYLALTNEVIGQDLSSQDRLYNRYYWFNRYVAAYDTKFGYDAGNEQQAFMIIEYPDCEVDWNVLEELHNAARGTQ